MDRCRHLNNPFFVDVGIPNGTGTGLAPFLSVLRDPETHDKFEEIIITQVVAAVSPGWATSAAVVVSILFSLNLILLVFNLIPLPPLDGSNVLLFFLSDRDAERYESFLYQPMHRMIGLVVAVEQARSPGEDGEARRREEAARARR